MYDQYINILCESWSPRSKIWLFTSLFFLLKERLSSDTFQNKPNQTKYLFQGAEHAFCGDNSHFSLSVHQYSFLSARPIYSLGFCAAPQYCSQNNIQRSSLKRRTSKAFLVRYRTLWEKSLFSPLQEWHN